MAAGGAANSECEHPLITIAADSTTIGIVERELATVCQFRLKIFAQFTNGMFNPPVF
jgi:hypothetical protein